MPIEIVTEIPMVKRSRGLGPYALMADSVIAALSAGEPIVKVPMADLTARTGDLAKRLIYQTMGHAAKRANVRVSCAVRDEYVYFRLRKAK
jgi:hypothetical protein